MDVAILGPLVVRRNGVLVTIGAAKQRALFTLLVLRRGELVPTDTLVEALWDGDPPATATKIVHGYVSQLRKALGDGVVETQPGGYLLRIESGDVDAARFEALLSDGRAALAAGAPGTAARELGEALALWRGPALAEFRFHDFAGNEIRRLDELRLLALEDRLDAEIALGRSAQAIPELQALVREHPLRENLRRLLMLALYRAERQADALAAYQDARRAMVDELGIEPGESLQRLEAAILAHDPPEVAAPPPAPPPRPDDGEPSRRPSRRRRALVATAIAGAAALVAVCIVALLPNSGAEPRQGAPSADSVGFIGADAKRVSAQVAVTGAPTEVAYGDGAVWVVNSSANSVTRVDPSSHSVVQTIAVGADPAGDAVGGGSVWVANHDANTVSRISPESNTVVQTIRVGAGPVAVAYGAGSVWVTNSYDRTLTRIDPATGTPATPIHTNAVGRGVVFGNGVVWVTDEAANRIVGVDPATNSVAATRTVGAGPTAIAYGLGSIWVVNALDGTVSRVDATTLAVPSAISVPGGPTAISVASGSVWVSAEFASRVYRIDPVRGIIAGSTAIGNRPEGLAATDSGVWVAVQAAGVGHRGGRLVVVGTDLELGSIDPAVGDIFGGVARSAYDALTGVRYAAGSANTEIVPDLAAALPQPTADGTSYTFHLRSGIKYSDGRPVVAADFRRALERILQINAGFPGDYGPVVGAAKCVGASRCDLSSGVIVQGTSTITFRLTVPDPKLFEDLTLLVPVPAGTPSHDVGTTPVPSTGPYTISSYVPDRLLVLERNPYFHVWSAAARPEGYPDELVYRVTDNTRAVKDVLAGRADLVGLGTEPAAVAQFATQHPGQVHVEEALGLVFVFLNVHRPPFDDIRVRRALNYAVDRERAVALNGAGLAQPACQLVPPTVSGYRRYCPYTLNPNPQGRWTAADLATARSLVEASGTKGDSVVLWTFSEYLPEAKYVVGVLDNLGYRATVHQVPDNADYFDILSKAPRTQAGMFGWFGSPFAVDMLSTVKCDFTLNPSHFCDPRIDAQIAQLAQREPTDPAGAADLAAMIDREVTDQAPWVPLIAPQSLDVTSARVGNYQSQLGLVLVDQLWVK